MYHFFFVREYCQLFLKALYVVLHWNTIIKLSCQLFLQTLCVILHWNTFIKLSCQLFLKTLCVILHWNSFIKLSCQLFLKTSWLMCNFSLKYLHKITFCRLPCRFMCSCCRLWTVYRDFSSSPSLKARSPLKASYSATLKYKKISIDNYWENIELLFLNFTENPT